MENILPPDSKFSKKFEDFFKECEEETEEEKEKYSELEDVIKSGDGSIIDNVSTLINNEHCKDTFQKGIKKFLPKIYDIQKELTPNEYMSEVSKMMSHMFKTVGNDIGLNPEFLDNLNDKMLELSKPKEGVKYEYPNVIIDKMIPVIPGVITQEMRDKIIEDHMMNDLLDVTELQKTIDTFSDNIVQK